MDVNLIVTAVSGLFFAGIIKGATGIGYSSCALPFLVASLGLKEAIVLVVAPAMASNVAVLFTTGSLKHSLRKFWPLYVATLPGILFGVFLLTWVDKRIPTQVLGVIICAYAILALLRPALTISPRIARTAQVPGRSFEWGVDGLHGLAGDALDALHACPQPGARAFCSGGKHRCRGRISFLGYRSMDSGPDVGAGFQLVRSGNRAGVAWGPTWKLGETAYPSVAVQVHRARGPASDRLHARASSVSQTNPIW